MMSNLIQEFSYTRQKHDVWTGPNSRVRFFTKILDQITNLDHYDFSLREETMYPKKGLFLAYVSLISIETTNNIHSSPEKL